MLLYLSLLGFAKAQKEIFFGVFFLLSLKEITKTKNQKNLGIFPIYCQGEVEEKHLDSTKC